MVSAVVTFTFASHVACPPVPVTVAVYRVEAVGETDFEPEAIGVMAPTPWLMVPEVALVLVQVSVDELPGGMEAGDAVSVQKGSDDGVMTFTRYGSTLHPEMLLS